MTIPREETAAPQTRHFRHEIDQAALLFQRDGGASDPASAKAMVVDISFSGIRVECERDFLQHSQVGIRLITTSGQHEEVMLVTRWCRAQDEGGFQLGMQFVEEGALLSMLGLDPATMEKLHDSWKATVPAAHCRESRLVIQQSTRIAKIKQIFCTTQGDLEIEHGLEDSHLEVEGALTIYEGGVVGGEIFVAMRTEINQAGDAQGTPTSISLGFHPSDIADVHRRAMLILDKRNREAEGKKAEVEAFNNAGGEPSHEDREKLMALMFEMQGKDAEVDSLREKIEMLHGLIDRKTLAQLSIKDTLHRGVSIGLFAHPHRYQAVETITGPTYIKANGDGQLVMVDDNGDEIPLDQCKQFKRCA